MYREENREQVRFKGEKHSVFLNLGFQRIPKIPFIIYYSSMLLPVREDLVYIVCTSLNYSTVNNAVECGLCAGLFPLKQTGRVMCVRLQGLL